jgi:hypothetical protein
MSKLLSMLFKLGCIWKLLFILVQWQLLRFATEILEKIERVDAIAQDITIKK